MTSEIRANKQTNRVGLGTVEYTNTGIIVSGIVTCTELSGLTALNIAGVGTANTLDINGDIDVDGHTNLDNVSIAGVTTIRNAGGTKLYEGSGNGSKLFHAGTERLSTETYGIDINGELQCDTLDVDGNGDISGNLVLGGDLDVDGHTNLDHVSIAGVTTFTNSYIDFKPGNGGNAHFRILSTGSGDAGIFFDAANGDISGSDYVFIGQKNNLDFVINPNANAGNIDFQRAGTTQVRIDSSGNMGLGTNNPQRLLHLQSTGDALARITSADGNAAYLELGDVSDPDGGKIVYDSANNLELYTASSPRLRIDSNGRILIGHSSAPTASLSVAVVGSYGGGSTNTPFVYLCRDEAATAISGGESLGQILFASNDGYRGAVIEAKAAGTWSGSSSDGYLVFKTTPDNATVPTEKLRITSTGRIEVGTGSGVFAAAPIEVKVSSSSGWGGYPEHISLVDQKAYDASDNGGGIVFSGKFNSGGSATTFGGIHCKKSNTTDGDYGGILTFNTREHANSNFERMRIDSYGRVFINSVAATTPTADYRSLNIVAHAHSEAGISFSRSHTVMGSGSTGGQSIILLNDGSLSFQTHNVGEKLRITSTGNVMIGSGSPSFASIGGNTEGGLEIHNLGNDTAACLKLTGNNNTGTPGQETYTQLEHRGGNLTFNINHNGTQAFNIGTTGNIYLKNCSTIPSFTTSYNVSAISLKGGGLMNYQENNIYLLNNIHYDGAWRNTYAGGGGYITLGSGTMNHYYYADQGSANQSLSLIRSVSFYKNNSAGSSLNTGNRPAYQGSLIIWGHSSATTAGGIEFHSSGGGGAGYGSRITSDSDGTLSFHVRNNNSAWTTPLQYKSNGDLSWGENPNNTLYDEGSNHGAYYRRQQGSFQFATKSSSGWSNVYINKNTSGGTNDSRWVDFYWNSSSIGQITHSSGNVVYGGQSDYRLKENVVDITDGISRVKQLQPRRFNWISDETNTAQDGFIAHEVQSVVPVAVTGTKDQVVTQEEFNNDTQPEDKEVGTPIYQQMDYGKVTPLLTAAVKELIAKVETLEAEVALLKG